MSPRVKEPEVYVARTSGVVRVQGKLYRYTEGRTRIGKDHPLRAALPDRFVPLTLDYEETAKGPRS